MNDWFSVVVSLHFNKIQEACWNLTVRWPSIKTDSAQFGVWCYFDPLRLFEWLFSA